MKIDEIIKKSIEVPGISIKRSEYSAELILKEKDGKGTMTFFPLFPGLTLAYIFINSPTWAAPDFRDNGSIETGPLLLNYCVTGRCELILNNGNFVYVKDGEISLTERFARQQYVYPRRIYEGMEFFIDMDAAAEQSTWIQTEFDIDFHKIRELYCPAGSTYISAISPEIEEILKKLWSLLDISVPLSIMQMKIYTLALFSLLQNLKEISHDIHFFQPCFPHFEECLAPVKSNRVSDFPLIPVFLYKRVVLPLALNPFVQFIQHDIGKQR